jgi:hypothetical protein
VKTLFIITTLLGTVAFGADKVPDLTNQDVATFKAHVNKVVSVHGVLRKPNNNGTTLRLAGVAGDGVIFYVRFLTPPQGSPSWPKAWIDLVGQPVLVTGTLGFQSFGRSPSQQSPPDYFYMEYHSAKIEPLKKIRR